MTDIQSSADSALPRQKSARKNFVPYEVMISDSKGLRVETVMLYKDNDRLELARLPTFFSSAAAALDYFNPSPLGCSRKNARTGSVARPSQ